MLLACTSTDAAVLSWLSGDYGEEGGGDDEDYEGEGGGSGDDDGEGGDGADPWVKFPFYHVEPMATCLVTLEGRLVVDFVMRWGRAGGGAAGWLV